jgi:ribosomal protein L11 methyltransferase
MSHSGVSQKVVEVLASLDKPRVGAYEILKGVFINNGFAFNDIIEQEISGRRAFAVYCPSHREAKLFERKLTALNLPGLSTSITILHQNDWLSRWKTDWKPFSLTKSLDVVPVWCRPDYKERRGRQFLLLDTISSFGTGLHETTRFMAEFIEEMKGKFTRFLDVGTGTGILTLVAWKCGADDLYAIDMDDMCIDAARANFKANGCPSQDRIILKDLLKFKPAVPFDFVCANLVTHDLIRTKRQILSFVKPGGWLAVSGISLENLPKLRKAFAALPLRCIKIKRGQSWSALLFKRKS